MSRAARLFRDQEHYRTLWFARECWGAPEDDGEVYSVFLIAEPDHVDAKSFLDGSDAFAAGLIIEAGDILYAEDRFYLNDALVGWVPLPPQPGLYAKAVDRECEVCREY